MRNLRAVFFGGLLLLSFNAVAIDLKVTIDPTLLLPGNGLEYKYQLITCGNKVICTNDEHSDASSGVMPSEHVLEYLAAIAKDVKGSLPAHSTTQNKDSFISFDIRDNKNNKLNLPRCKKVINGLKQLTITITPKGCIVS